MNSTYATGVAGASMPTAGNAMRQPVIDEAYDTLSQTRALSVRVMELADRLCGAVPDKGEASIPAMPPMSDFDRLRASMRDTRQSLVFADEALTRIERELIG